MPALGVCLSGWFTLQIVGEVIPLLQEDQRPLAEATITTLWNVG